MLVFLMLLCFAAAQLWQTVLLAKKQAAVTKSEQYQAVTAGVGFLAGFFAYAILSEPAPAAVCLIGFVISEFSVAIAFYDRLKEMEVPCE